jgi:hypothetical protein
MDGHGVVFQDPFLGDLVGPGDGTSFSVTLSAKQRDIDGGRGGSGLPVAADVMPPVTVHAGRGEAVPSGCRLPVEGVGVLPGFGGVAKGAVHRRYVSGGVGQRQVLVAERAPDPGWSMDGPGQVLRGHQEPISVFDPLEHGRIAVTQEAHLVIGLRLKGGGGDG